MNTDHPLGLRPGMQVGPWRIQRQLGAGSFGAVFQVEHAGQRHALKFALRGPGSEDLNQTDARAARELACLLQAAHPNVVRVWAHGRWPDARTGYHYVVLDYVEGTTLATWVERSAPSARRVARLFSRLAWTLGELHARTVFHRDLKPSNILVRADDEEPVLVDFGSADHAESRPLTEGPLPPGTPQYRSPEALRFQREHHARPDARYPFRATDDLYALGVTLHEVLTGAPAYSRTLPRELLVEYIETRDPAPASSLNPRVPQALEALARRLMHKQSEARFPDGAALHEALEAALRGATAEWDVPLHPRVPAATGTVPSSPPESTPRHETPPTRSRGAWGLLGAVALIGLSGLVGWSTSARHPGPPSASPPSPRVAAVGPAGGPAGTTPLGPSLTAAPVAATKAPPSPPAPQPSVAPTPPPKEQTVKPSANTPAHPRSPPAPRRLRDTLARCTVGMAAAASLQCAGAPGAGPGPGERPRRGPCPPEVLERQTEWLSENQYSGYPKVFYPNQQDWLFVDASWDERKGFDIPQPPYKPGPITSRVYGGRTFPKGSLLTGWVYADAAGLEVQYTEIQVVPDAPNSTRLPRELYLKKGFTLPICARLGTHTQRRLRPLDDSVPASEFMYSVKAGLFVVDHW
ncbi:protein kinase [Myxococcus sp. K15C18031901]|uniref:serine/threonine-protein kinase n=1 Tax=Myxococcus dinghuensis TaxID=2906761 RepID=UPI0020A7C1E1|nr:serine/threonine-protein kinase [Myxococcus dinghuensis]MCP3103002.1 protein kinase [Myxococcus dinghuensis]